MKKSLKRQVLAAFIGLIVFVVAGMFIVNGNFLEQYYVKNKINDLTQMYKMASLAVDDGSMRKESALNELARYSEQSNISALIADEDGNAIYIAARDDSRVLLARLMEYVFGGKSVYGEVLERTTFYEINRVTDSANDMEYLEMWGYLAGSELFIMRSPMESIQESAAIANRFLLYMGCIAMIVGAIIAWFFSKKITGPILELAELSKKMADLDFDAKYVSGGDNEIGVLGQNFNSMSETLEKTISELKNANNELQKDIAQKEEIEKMRSEFLGNVSHELKTPIALIQGYAEGLKEGVNEEPESREFYCDVIMDEAMKMNRMVKNLLTLNQLEFGESDLQITRFDLTKLVQGVLQSCEILIQNAQAKVDFVQDGTVYVWSDEFKTEQVLRNYLTNAIHHVDGERRIEIRIQQMERVVRVSVYNSGKRISEEDIQNIWDKFYKADKAHTREYGGNGIGLSIVRAIMESLHQQYGVENHENGVEFWFELDSNA